MILILLNIYHYVANIMFPMFFFCRNRSTELISTIENLQLNNKRLVEQHTAMQAQVCGLICIYTASNRFFLNALFQGLS